jgi:hypothetical protein
MAKNGSALSSEAGVPSGIRDNFGIGLVGNSSNNLIEKNKIGGNANVVFIGKSAGAQGSNPIRHNCLTYQAPDRLSVRS